MILSLCKGWNMKTRRIFTQEWKSVCPRGVFCPSSIPSEYLFPCTRRKFGFNKKIHRKSHNVYLYFKRVSLKWLRRWSKRVLRRNRNPLSGILASCFSKIKKPNEYCFGNQKKFSIFLRNDRDCMVVDQYKARKRYTVTETLFLCTRRKFGFNKKIRTKLAFPPQQKNWHNRTTVVYTKNVSNTKNNFPPEPKKITWHHNCMVL